MAPSLVRIEYRPETKKLVAISRSLTATCDMPGKNEAHVVEQEANVKSRTMGRMKWWVVLRSDMK